MAVRALIIAIESYAAVDVGGIAKELPGTLQAGLEFKKWLEEKWTAEGREAGETQLLFCSEPTQAGGFGATRKDILKALLRLKQDGQNATDELYVFFSGHGFSFVQKPGSRADVLLSSDFESPSLSAHCCLNLDEIIAWLRDHLGPGRHFYFVDACRNPLDASQIQIGSLLPIDPNTSAEASTFVLQSTVEGATAAVGGPFPSTLMAGLRGKGKSKAWDDAVPDAMFVRYDSLRQFVKTHLAKKQAIASRVEGPEGEGDVVLATLRPIPLSQCTVQVANASAQDKGELFLKRRRSTADDRRPLGSQPLVFQVEPDTYSVFVKLRNAEVTPSEPVAVDLYDDRTVVFMKVEPGLSEPLGPPSLPPTLEPAAAVDVDVVVPPQAELRMRDLETGTEQSFGTSGRVSLTRGRYVAAMADKDGRVFKRREVDVGPGEKLSVDLAGWLGSPPHVAIASRLPVLGGGVEFSEALGGMVTDPDLNLWLALVGGGRLLGSRGDYSKLGKLPLHDFANEPAGASPIYVLAGFEDPATELRIGVARNAGIVWSAAVEPPGMAGIREAYVAAKPGSQLVSFAIKGQAPYTLASLASPNRGMLITLTLDDDGNLRLSQYLLPLGHLLQSLPAEVRDRIERRNHLNDVRFLAQASRAFRKRRDLTREVSARELEELLYAKWLDPIASSLAAYELLRRGRKEDIAEVVWNMKRFFPDLPDTAALAKLNGERINRPPGVPLFLDGLRAFPNYAKWLPLPAGHLDFTSPWTAWRAAAGR